jgi:hypothetical protein
MDVLLPLLMVWIPPPSQCPEQSVNYQSDYHSSCFDSGGVLFAILYFWSLKKNCKKYCLVSGSQ